LREPVQFFEQTTRSYVDEHLWTLRCDLATGASQTLMSSFDVLAMELHVCDTISTQFRTGDRTPIRKMKSERNAVYSCIREAALP
jgi:hypothetical protein